VNAAAIEERFARDARGFGGHVFETAAAVHFGRTVYDELRQTRALRRRTPPDGRWLRRARRPRRPLLNRGRR
jgi:hypothetical protein